MVTLTIDGREVQAAEGTTILKAARQANISIPHLCENDELLPYGACRLCVVEIKQGKRTRIVASCIYEVAEGLEVDTRSERVLNVRKLVIELLLARNPKHPALLKIAEDLGVKKSRFEPDIKGCIMCGLCIRTCREVVGVSAIGYQGRGVGKRVATPFEEAPPDCIACGACHYVCPVDVIPMKDENGVRTIWNTEFPLQKCEVCGRYFAPIKQLEFFKEKYNLPADQFTKCVDCR